MLKIEVKGMETSANSKEKSPEILSEKEKATETSNMTTEEQLDRIFEHIGFGRFQIFAYLVITSGLSSPEFFFYLLGYLIQVPAYKCTYNGEAPSENICTA